MNARSFSRDCSCSYSVPECSSKLPAGRLRLCYSLRQKISLQKHRNNLLLGPHFRTCDLVATRAADLSADVPQGEPDDEPPIISEVFPRIREGNPYRRLGISEEASFEEIQEARNFLYEAYKHHEPSRDSIELAYDRILKTAFKRREKFGFQPPNTGRRTDLQGETLRPTLRERIIDAVEPSLGIATIVNDGSIFLVLGIWAAWQATATDPTFPMALALIYSVYKFFTKRKNRNPDGPFFGGSPIWAALGMTVLGFAVGLLLCGIILKLVPLPPQFPGDSVALFVLCTVVGLFTLFFR